MKKPIKVYQYNLDGNYIKTYFSINEASKEFSITFRQLKLAILNQTSINGFILKTKEPVTIYRQSLPKPLQFDIYKNRKTRVFKSISPVIKFIKKNTNEDLTEVQIKAMLNKVPIGEPRIVYGFYVLKQLKNNDCRTMH